ncbi:MAG TPA: hypothetical protein VHS28_00420, partial [Chloroflexota bacterium]|nr:hypothetical protein [Chloroflexota bacterium]
MATCSITEASGGSTLNQSAAPKHSIQSVAGVLEQVETVGHLDGTWSTRRGSIGRSPRPVSRAVGLCGLATA